MTIEDKPNLNPDDFEGYGEEMIDMVGTVNTALAENKKLKEDLGTVQNNVSQTSENILLDHLDKAVPNWESINSDPGFLNWLGQVDPLTGIRRQDLLNDAYNARDSQRVANFFSSWRGEGGRQIQDTDDGSGRPSSSQKSKITFAQYNKAVKDAQTGRITEEEFEKIANQYQRQFGAT